MSLKLRFKILAITFIAIKAVTALECAKNAAKVKGTTNALYNTTLSLIAETSNIISCRNYDDNDLGKCPRLEKGNGGFEIIYSEYEKINPDFRKLLNNIPSQINYQKQYTYELCASFIGEDGEIIISPEFIGNSALNGITLLN